MQNIFANYNFPEKAAIDKYRFNIRQLDFKKKNSRIDNNHEQDFFMRDLLKSMFRLYPDCGD